MPVSVLMGVLRNAAHNPVWLMSVLRNAAHNPVWLMSVLRNASHDAGWLRRHAAATRITGLSAVCAVCSLFVPHTRPSSLTDLVLVSVLLLLRDVRVAFPLAQAAGRLT